MANGTFIADIAFEIEEYSGRYQRIGGLLYFRSHECKVKLSQNTPVDRFVIGKFRPSEKVPDAPMLEGDMFLKKVKVGHIHSEQDAGGGTLYWMKFNDVIEVEETVWLRVELED